MSLRDELRNITDAVRGADKNIAQRIEWAVAQCKREAADGHSSTRIACDGVVRQSLEEHFTNHGCLVTPCYGDGIEVRW